MTMTDPGRTLSRDLMDADRPSFMRVIVTVLELARPRARQKRRQPSEHDGPGYDRCLEGTR